MNNITIGQYVPGNSWIYKMDPRMKIFLSIVWIVALFLVPNIYMMLGFLALTFVIIIASRIPLMKMIRGMKPILFLMIFTFIIQILFNKSDRTVLLYTIDFRFGLYPLLGIIGFVIVWIAFMRFMPSKMLWTLFIVFLCFAIQSTVLMEHLSIPDFLMKKNWSSYSVQIYQGSLINACFVVLRIIITICITSLLTFTTSSMEINNGFASLMSPLKYIKVPVGTIAMMLCLTLRFIPTLMNETNKIMKAQASRGVDFAEAKLKQKVSQIVSLLVPMLVISIKKADDLANSMEARGYVIDAKRTQIDVLKLRFLDYIALSFTIILVAGVIVGRIFL